MSVNKYINGKLLQMSGNADTRLTIEDIVNILGYTPANPTTIAETYTTNEYVKDVLKADLSPYSVSPVNDSYGDFNDYLDVGIYVFAKNVVVGNTANAPAKVAGTLIVTDYTGGSKDMGEVYAYRLQEFRTHDNSGIYMRVVQTGGSAELIIKDWVKVLDTTDVIDNLTSTDTDKPLSANQGTQLKTKMDTINKAMGDIEYISNTLLGLNTDVTVSLKNGLYLIFFSQTGAWDLTGFAFMSMTGYDNGSKYYFITGSSTIKSSLTVTLDASTKSVTFNNGTGCQFRTWIYRMVSWPN